MGGMNHKNDVARGILHDLQNQHYVTNGAEGIPIARFGTDALTTDVLNNLLKNYVEIANGVAQLTSAGLQAVRSNKYSFDEPVIAPQPKAPAQKMVQLSMFAKPGRK